MVDAIQQRDINERDESRMRVRLIEWGNIMLRGLDGPNAAALFDTDEGRRKPAWTGKQREAAKAMHDAVIALPELRLTLVLMVMYGAGEASLFDSLPVPRQRRLMWEWSRETNARITPAARERRIVPVYVQAGDFIVQRDRGVRILIAGERAGGLPKVRHNGQATGSESPPPAFPIIG